MSEALIDPKPVTVQSTAKPSVTGIREPSLPDLGFLWLVLFVFGGGLFALYYSNIGYIPDIKWEDSVVYVGALTLAGAFLFSLYFALLYIPGWIWSEFLIHGKLDCIFCDGNQQPLRWRIIRDIGAPFAAFLACAHILLDLDIHPISIGAWTGVALILCTLLMALIIKMMEERGSNLTFESLVFFAGSSLASFFSMLLIRQSFDTEPGQAMYVVCTVMVTVVNLYVAMVCKNKPKSALLIMAGAALVLLVLGDFLVGPNEKRISARIMSKFGIGFDHPVTLLLNEDGARVLRRHGIEIDESGKLGPEAHNLEILSRLGSEYFLRSEKLERCFSFPKSGIESWYFEKTSDGSGKPETPSPRLAATAGGS